MCTVIVPGYAQNPDDENKEETKKEKAVLFISPLTANFLSEDQARSIRKQMILVASKQLDFQIALGDKLDFQGMKTSIFTMDVEIKRSVTKGLFNVRAVLLDETNKRVVSKIKRENIKSRELLRSSQVALELLFRDYEEMKAKEEKAPEKKVTIKKKKAEKDKKKLVQLVNPEALSKKQVDFKKRIQDLEKDVEVSIEEAKESVAKKKKKEEEEKKSSTNKISKLEKKAEKQQPKKDPILARKQKSEFSVGFTNQDVLSKDILEVRNTIQYLSVGYMVQKEVAKDSTWHYEYGLLFGKPVSKVEEEISSYKKLGGGIRKYFTSLRADIAIGLSLETLTFINLPEAGGGIKVAENNIIWADYTIDKTIAFKDYLIDIGIAYGKTISSSTKYKTLESTGLVGTKIGAYIDWTGLFLHNMRLQLAVNKFDLSGGPVTVTNTESKVLIALNFK